MTRKQILGNIYQENKRYIIGCLTACLLFSVLAFGGDFRALAGTAEAQNAAAKFGGSFGKLLAPVVGLGFFAGIDTSWVMVIMSAVSLIASAGKSFGLEGFGIEKLFGFSFGVFENPYVSVFLLLWFGMPIFLKMFGVTYATGVAWENSTKKWNGLVLMILSMSQLIESAAPASVAIAAAKAYGALPAGAETVAGSFGAQALSATTVAGGLGTAASGLAALTGGVRILLCFGLLVLTLLLYFLIRYLFALFDIVLIPFCSFIPLMSFSVMMGKIIILAILLALAKFAPLIFAVVLLLTVALAIWLFRLAYCASRYLKNIFAKPLVKKIFGGYDKEYPLIANKIPARVKSQPECEGAELVIPVYLQKAMPQHPEMHLFDRWWMVAANGRVTLLKPLFWKKECLRITLEQSAEQKVFLNRFRFFHEIFGITGSEETLTRSFGGAPKAYHIVFSKEYFHRYPEIVRITGFTEFAQYRDWLKQEQALRKAQEKAEKKAERKSGGLLGNLTRRQDAGK